MSFSTFRLTFFTLRIFVFIKLTFLLNDTSPLNIESLSTFKEPVLVLFCIIKLFVTLTFLAVNKLSTVKLLLKKYCVPVKFPSFI